MLKKILYSLLILTLIGAILLAGAATWAYNYVTRDLPDFHRVEDYRPPAVTRVFSDDGTLIGEFFWERRYPVKLSQVPDIIRHAFLAAEDANFYTHQGIDPISIIRAVVKNLRSGSAKQGGSTITQQVVKNLLLTREKKIERKIKEAILSYRIEQRLTKDEIFEIYLNQIFFGNTAYGIRAAAKTYFRKELDQVTLAEAAMLAGLPKAPSKYSPLLNKEESKRRQRYVLGRMVSARFITSAQSEAALQEKVNVYPATQENIYHAPYFVSELRRVLGEKWRDLNIDSDGFDIYTSLNLTADHLAEQSLRKGLREVDKRRGWRGPIDKYSATAKAGFYAKYGQVTTDDLTEGTLYPALVTSIVQGIAQVDLGGVQTSVSLRDPTWARRFLDKNDRTIGIRPEDFVRVGDVFEVSIAPEDAKDKQVASTKTKSLPKFILDQTPEIEGAIVILDPNSGKVVSMVGGYSYQTSVFNRATQSLRQPGSAFKPIVYLSAVDGFKYTPATIVNDSPRTFRVGDEIWTPGNFDSKYLGPITLRTALERSRNLVSAEIVSRIGVDPIIQYAVKLGITSKLGRNLSLSLGSSEVTLLELARAYGVFAAKGVLFDSVMVTKIVGRDGKDVYDYESDKFSHARPVLSENSAFIMANMMKGVIEHGTGYRVKEIGRPVAGKTGTSNDEMDAWFIGYTPEWVCGVWSGFDVKKKIGNKETGGVVSAPIWLYAMRDFLALEDERKYKKLVEEAKLEAERLGIEYLAPDKVTPLDFSPPDGVDPYWVDKSSGTLSAPNAPNAILEYFLRGTEPAKTFVNPISGEAESSKDATSTYLGSPDL